MSRDCGDTREFRSMMQFELKLPRAGTTAFFPIHAVANEIVILRKTFPDLYPFAPD